MENRDLDILLELDKELTFENAKVDDFLKAETKNNYIYQVIVEEETKKEEKIEKKNIFKWIIFITKYLTTSFLIFAVLLVWTNYNAYINVAKWFLFQEDYKKESVWILNSVEASNLKEKSKKETTQTWEVEKEEQTSLSIKKYKKELDEKNISLNIEITPYENRVVIPKLWKNIPLINIKNQKVDSTHELENIFMKELENWVVRYPGSAIPGEKWNAFIFWHSSNFPWMGGDYNEVFSNLNFLENWDEVIIYYNQKKYIYTINEKKVIKPGDVSVLKRNPEKKELSIMTCWPIWTTLNRLVVIWEMKEEN